MTRFVCLLLTLTTLTTAACTATRSPARTNPQTPTGVSEAAPTRDPLEAFIQKVRRLAAEARPSRLNGLTIETADPRLAAALQVAALAPNADNYRRVSAEYRRLQIGDKAFEYLMKAIRHDPADAAVYDDMARLWRDWGLPQLALADAQRARYFAPFSPVVHNTLGTVLQALGSHRLALEQYGRALELDPTAAYALSNLCYGWTLEGQARKAVDACDRALRLQPGFTVARNNLGLAHAVDGDIDAARTAFGAGGDAAAAQYNTGIVLLARHQYAEAVKAFDAATALRPAFQLAATRAGQAREMEQKGKSE